MGFFVTSRTFGKGVRLWAIVLFGIAPATVAIGEGPTDQGHRSFQEALKACQRLEADIQQLSHQNDGDPAEVSRSKATLTGARVHFFEFVEQHQAKWLPWQREFIESWARGQSFSSGGKRQWSAYLEKKVISPQAPGFWNLVEKMSGPSERARLWKLSQKPMEFTPKAGRSLASAKPIFLIDDPWAGIAEKAGSDSGEGNSDFFIQLSPFPSVEAMADELKLKLEAHPGEKVIATRGLASAVALQFFDSYPDAVQRFQIRAWINVDGSPYGRTTFSKTKNPMPAIAEDLEKSLEQHYFRFAAGIPSIPGLMAVNVVSANYSPESLLPEVPIYKRPKGPWSKAAVAGSQEIFPGGR